MQQEEEVLEEGTPSQIKALVASNLDLAQSSQILKTQKRKYSKVVTASGCDVEAQGEALSLYNSQQSIELPPPFLMTYFGVRPEKSRTINRASNGGSDVEVGTQIVPSRKNKDLAPNGSNSLLSATESDLKDARNNSPQTHTFQENLLMQQAESSSWSMNSSQLQWRDLYYILRDSLLNVWTEQNDPTLYYYPSIKSHTDHDLLNHQMRKKKILGLFLILNALNIVNLLIPTSYCSDDSNINYFNQTQFKNIVQDGVQSQISGTNSSQHNSSSTMFILNNASGHYATCFVNLVCEALIFCFSFYVCFCSPFHFLSQHNTKSTILVSLTAQYIMAGLFAMFPNEFVFQFLVNVTVMFLLIAKEVITNKKILWVLLANTFTINYLAIHGLKQHQKVHGEKEISILGDLINYESYARAHIFGLVGVVLQVVQIQCLNRSLIKMLVNRINAMQHTLDIKDTYNASMIHELRNPLNAVLGSIGLLKYSKSLTKEDLETLNIANVSGEILITFINNALDGAKLEANKLELDYQMADVVETLTKSVSLFSWKAKEKKVSITLKIGKNMPNLVEIDEARLTQILVNLIGNAVKFTPSHGQVKVRARFIPDDQDISQRLDQNNSLRPATTTTTLLQQDQKPQKLDQDLQFKKSRVSKPSFSHSKYFKENDYGTIKKSGTQNDLQSEQIDEEKDLEIKEFEDKFFYNKDITNEMIQSEDQTQNSFIVNNQRNNEPPAAADDHLNQNLASFLMEATGGADCNYDSHSESGHPFLQNKPLIKIDSKLSSSTMKNLTNNAICSSEELDDHIDIQIERDLTMKNAFLEWSGRNVNNNFFNTMVNQIQPNLMEEEIKAEHPDFNTLQTQQNEQNDEIYSVSKKESSRKPLRKDYGFHRGSSQALSEALIVLDNQLSIETFGVPETSNSKIYTGSLNSLPHLSGLQNLNGGSGSINQASQSTNKKPNPIKSKFYKENSSFFGHNNQQLKESELDQKRELIDQSQELQENLIQDNNQNQQVQDQTRLSHKTDGSKSHQSPTYRTNVQGRLMIEVIDTGIGISQDGIKKLFKPFSQADKSIQTKYGGTGLGLWISNKLVSLMRGKISVVSELSKGTVFIIEIPVESEVTVQIDSAIKPTEDFPQKYNLMETMKFPQDQQDIEAQFPPKVVTIQRQPTRNVYWPNNENLSGFQQLKITQNNDEEEDSSSDDLRVLLFQHDEMMKNLFKKYLQKHKIFFNFAINFKDLLQTLKTKQYKACFIDIDINVKSEDLDQLVDLNESFRSENPPFKCRIYCFHSRDIDRQVTRFLQRNKIHCVKKPIQAHQLSKYLRRVKNSEYETQLMAIKKSTSEFQGPNKNPPEQESNMPIKLNAEYSKSQVALPISTKLTNKQGKTQEFLPSQHSLMEKDPLDVMTELRSRATTTLHDKEKARKEKSRVASLGSSKHMSKHNSLASSSFLDSSRINQSLQLTGGDNLQPTCIQYSKSKFKKRDKTGNARHKQFDEVEFPEEEDISRKQEEINTQGLIQQTNSPYEIHQQNDSDDYLEKLQSMIPKVVRNKQIERLKRQEQQQQSFLFTSVGGGISGDEHIVNRGSIVSKSSSEIGGSNSDNTSKDYSQFNFGELAANDQRNNNSINIDDQERQSFRLSEDQFQKTYYSFKNLKDNGIEQSQNIQKNTLVTDPEFFEEEKHFQIYNNFNSGTLHQHLETPQFNHSMATTSVINSNSGNSSSTIQNNQRGRMGSFHHNASQRLRHQENSTSSSGSNRIIARNPPNSRQQPRQQHGSKQPINTPLPTILIVDDNSINTMIIQRMLETIPQLQGRTRQNIAENGKEAVDIFKGENNQAQQTQIKLVLMDCEMPIMDGYQATQLIREWERIQGWPRTMIVGVSGNSGDQFEKKCRQNGMDMMITKPINVEQLKRLVEQSVFKQ